MDWRTGYLVSYAWFFLLLTCQLCSGDPVLKDEMGSACLYFQKDDAILPCNFYEQTNVHSGNMEQLIYQLDQLDQLFERMKRKRIYRVFFYPSKSVIKSGIIRDFLGVPVGKVKMGPAHRYFQREDAILPRRFYEQKKIVFLNMVGKVEMGFAHRYVPGDDAFLPRQFYGQPKFSFRDRGVPVERVDIGSAYRYVQRDDAILPRCFFGEPKVHFWDRGVPVERVDIGSAYRYFQRDDAILLCHFYGKPKVHFWDREAKGLHIVWFANGDSFPKINNKRTDILDDFLPTIPILTASDTGRYLCKVSEYRGYLIWNKTDLQVAENKNWIVHTLLLLSCVLRYNVASGEVITDENAVLIKGSEASLQCSFHGTPLQLLWFKMDFGPGGLSMAQSEPLIAWYNGRTQRGDDNGKFNVSDNFSLTFTADIGDAGRYLCDVSNYRGLKIRGYTDVTVAAPPSDPFPMIDNFTISDGNRPTTITCRADGASIGLVDLQWMHNGNQYPQINRNFTNADGTTENLTATIEAQVSEEPYICVGTMNASKRVNSTDEALVQRTLISTIPSEEPTEQLTTPIEVTDNNDSTVIAVVVPGSILLALTVIATAYICVKKNSPVCHLWLYKPYKMEGRQQGGPKATLQQGVNNVGSQRDASVILMTPGKQ